MAVKRGKVCSLKHNYGYIKAGREKDYFFHRDDFNGHWEDLKRDFNSNVIIGVEFIEVGSNKGLRAGQVNRLGHPNETPVHYEDEDGR